MKLEECNIGKARVLTRAKDGDGKKAKTSDRGFDTSKVLHHRFDCLSDFYDFVDEHKKDNYYSVTTSPETFNGNQTWDEAMQKARCGDTEHIREMNAKLDKIESDLQEYGSRWRFDDHGEIFDVGLVLQGEPEHWLQEEPKPSRPTLTVVVNVSAVCTTRAEEIIRRGAAIVAVLNRLADYYNIELYIGEAVLFRSYNALADNNYPANLLWECKVSTDPIDVASIAFAIANPAFLRRLGFTWLEIWDNNRECSGYGKPHNHDQWVLDSQYATAEHDQVLFFPKVEAGNREWQSDEAAEEFIIGIVEKYTKGRKKA